MNKVEKRCISVILLLVFLLSLLPASLAQEENVLHIRTTEDLIDFSKKCSLDTWSDGMYVYLDSDLSLSDSDFAPIPIFNGTFDGQNHSIMDLSLSLPQSPCGLFLVTGENAVIRNLAVSGSVLSVGDDSMVGGIVGQNGGQIVNCTFTGEVSGKDQIGGIVGKNEASGIITGCTSCGRVFGLNAAGGIAGNNEGALSACISRSLINTESVDPSLRLDAIDTSSIINFVRTLTSDNAGITSDIGGIAGLSTGFVELCQNEGTVGYLHLGYNIGGVTGRSSGYLNGCLNYGTVFGRRDVGGIAGQAEPLVEITEAQNLLSSLSYAFYSLNESVQAAIDDARGVSDELVGQMAVLPGTLLPVADAFRGMDPADPEGSLESLREAIAGSVADMAAQMGYITSSMDGSSDTMIKDFEQIRDNMNALSWTAMQAMTILSGAEEEDVLVDESGDDVADAVIFGKIKNCVNYGEINGDSNVGGVAGSIALEDGIDPEEDLGGNPSSLVRNRFSFKAVILKCTNRGTVTAKRECAGGIVGRMDFGYVSNCAVYGSISLEDGDYAGGVAGLTYATVRNCVSKCSLSGKKYVGGIVGNGYTGSGAGKEEENRDRSSLVCSCYTLVEILHTPQFAGAVSGGSDGEYQENYFVDAGFAGIDKLSIHGKAEPIPFENFRLVKGIPEEATTFTLRFVCDGEVIREIPFEYGDSFDRSVFPEMPKKEAAYAVWDRTDLTDLHFDTTVTAQYRLDESVLRSAEVREDGRAAVYVDGQFQHGDAIQVTGLPIRDVDREAFSPTWLETARRQIRTLLEEHTLDTSFPVFVQERLRITLPEDGLKEHTLRYLAPDGTTRNHTLYLWTANGWEALHPETFGSYYLIKVPGAVAELALVSTIQTWQVIGAVLALLILFSVLFWLLGFLLRKRSEKRKKQQVVAPDEKPDPSALSAGQRFWRRIRTPLLCVLLGSLCVSLIAIGILRTEKVREGLSAYNLLANLLSEETDIEISTVYSEENKEETAFSSVVHRVSTEKGMVTVSNEFGIPLYLSGGTLYLENGKGILLTDRSLDQAALLEIALEVFRHGDIQETTEDGQTLFEAVVEGKSASALLQPFISRITGEAFQMEALDAQILSSSGILRSLCFIGTGTTGEGASFALSITLQPVLSAESIAVPHAVLTAMDSQGKEEVDAEDLLRLVSAWVQYERQPLSSAEIRIQSASEILNLDSTYSYLRQICDGVAVHRLATPLVTLYFTDSNACTATGNQLSTAQGQLLDSVKLIDAAKTAFLKSRFACDGSGTRYTYTLSLDEEAARTLAEELIPELKMQKITYHDCTMKLILEGEKIARIQVSCSGRIKIVSREVETEINVTARFLENASAAAIPKAVRSVLLP